MSILKVGRPSKERVLYQLETTQELAKININIARNFHKEIKRYALDHNMTITELIHKSLYEYMKK